MPRCFKSASTFRINSRESSGISPDSPICKRGRSLKEDLRRQVQVVDMTHQPAGRDFVINRLELICRRIDLQGHNNRRVVDSGQIHRRKPHPGKIKHADPLVGVSVSLGLILPVGSARQFAQCLNWTDFFPH